MKNMDIQDKKGCVTMILFRNGLVYSTMQCAFIKADLLVKDGKIADCDYRGTVTDEMTVIDCTGKYIMPGLVDVHTHGRGGYDFNRAGDEECRAMRKSYAQAGTTTLMATLASDTLDSLNASIDAAQKNRVPEEGMATIAGVHLEGRYLNPKRRGAHAEELLFPLDPDELTGLLNRMLPLPAHVSAAVELEGGQKFVRTAKELGATVGMVHSDATYAEAMDAVQWGVTSFTHTFNAMRPIHHREPGNMVASLMCDGAYTELICDGEHVHPAMIKMASRTKPHDKLILVTDSMEAAGCSDGTYSIAGLPVYVKNGRAVNNEGALAGSTLDLWKALLNFMSFTGRTLEEAIPCATSNPAAMLGISGDCGSIRNGARADFIMLENKNEPAIESVWICGAKI